MKTTDYFDLEDQLKIVGITLRELRQKKGYTSAEIFSYDFELNRTNYWRWENGQNITLKNIFRMCEIHQISLTDFFELIEKRNQKRRKTVDE
jgi:hypothetical protein